MIHTYTTESTLPSDNIIWTRNKYFIVEKGTSNLSLKGRYFSGNKRTFLGNFHCYGNLDSSNNLTINISNPSNYKYYFLDEFNKKLKGYTYMKYDEISHLISYNLIPYKCNKIGIFATGQNAKRFYLESFYDFIIDTNNYFNDKESEEIIGYIDISNTIKEKSSSLLYKVGIISDIHYDDYDTDTNPDTYSSNSSEYYKDFKNVCSFFKDENIDFICCCGDVTTDYIEHHNNFLLNCNKYLDKKIGFYTCSGNHDTKPKKQYLEGNGKWNEIQVINNEHTIIHSSNDEGTSFFFIKKNLLRKDDIFIFLDVEYGWDNSSNYDTHNCRKLNQNELLVHSTVQSDDYHLYNPNTLKWLAKLLEDYKDNRCFIFTHLMWKNHAGTYHGNQGYMKYWETHIDVLKGDQGEFLLNLFNKYDNNIWFNGHSHLKFNWQTVDNKVNISKGEKKSFSIHIPSLARPLYLSSYYNVANNDSECGILEVYENKVIFKGVELRTDKLGGKYDDKNIYLNKYTPLAQYELYLR